MSSIKKVNPEAIRAGQLVELQVGFNSISLNNKNTKAGFLRRLYSVCVLDRTYQLVSKKLRVKHTLTRNLGEADIDGGGCPHARNRDNVETENRI
jgi:hypothetical protein